MILHTLNQGRQALLVDRKPEDALNVLRPLLEQLGELEFGDKRALFELLGLAYQTQHLYDKALDAFRQVTDYYQAGYCYMLAGRIEKSTEYWSKLLTLRPNHWCLTLHGLVTGTLNAVPTFLQIRNHIEADIIHLSRANQTVMIQNLLKYVDFLADINYETYKFAGRALFNAGQIQQAGGYLLKGQKLLPNDPEVYYHLGQYYYTLGQLEESALMLHQCILISPTYLPAKELHQIIHPNTMCSLE